MDGSLHGQCVEYQRGGKGFVRRVIEPVFVTTKVNCGSRYVVSEMRRLRQNKEIPGTRQPSELPENLRGKHGPL